MAAGNTYVALATQTLASPAVSATFSSIPSGYTDLRIVLSNGNTNNPSNIAIQFNGVTSGSLYSNTNLYGNGSSAGSNRLSNRSDGIYIDYNVTFSSSSNANIIYDIMSYANTSTYKTVLGRVNAAGSATEAAVGTFRSTNAITDVTITTASANTFSTGTVFSIYGILAA